MVDKTMDDVPRPNDGGSVFPTYRESHPGMHVPQGGLKKRELFAVILHAAEISRDPIAPVDVAGCAVAHADALIAELERCS